MKISFTASNEQQDARKLRKLLQDLLANESESHNRSIIQSLLQDIDDCLADAKTVSEKPNPESGGFSPLGAIASFCHFLTGPSRRELALGRQRAELIERAEHAESSAFEALAELADLKQEYADMAEKLKQLERELAGRDKSSSTDNTA